MEEFRADTFAPRPGREGALTLGDGSRVAVIGGGPAGTFFSYFLLDMAERYGLDLDVTIYEPRDFRTPGPGGCNMCGGIISESLVQMLATDGINLGGDVVQRGIDSYVLHMDVGSVRIATPLKEKRIAAVHRGPGPRDLKHLRWESFDGHLLSLAEGRGATRIPEKVAKVDREEGRPRITIAGGETAVYDLLAVAAGVNSGAMKLLRSMDDGFVPPVPTKTMIREYWLGAETIRRQLGSAMHVFLLNLPRLEFAAIIPKGEYVTVALLGDDVDKELMAAFLGSEEVRRCMPPGWDPATISCMCSPLMNVRGAPRPFGDRVVYIGDSGVTRLFKDGIGAAYRTAKAAASAAVFQGVAAGDFEKAFLPVCRAIEKDNAVGRLIFLVMGIIQKTRVARGAVLRMVDREQGRPAGPPRMSGVLWDMFTGSAPYRDILGRTLHPAFWGRLACDLAGAAVGAGGPRAAKSGKGTP
ncbi:MAG: hypothetical protein ABIK65_07265 [Candidatus Eisenbacteria bacterium]